MENIYEKFVEVYDKNTEEDRRKADEIANEFINALGVSN